MINFPAKSIISQLATLIFINACLALCLLLVYFWKPSINSTTLGDSKDLIPSPSKTVPAAQFPSIINFSELIKRPLFTQERKPQLVRENVEILPNLIEAESVTIDNEANNNDWVLIGTFLTNDDHLAILRNSNNLEVTRVRKNDALGDWIVQSIKPKNVAIINDGVSKNLILHSKKYNKEAKMTNFSEAPSEQDTDEFFTPTELNNLPFQH